MPPEPLTSETSLLHAVLETALDCIICMDVHGRVQEFNPAAERTFGYSRAEVIGRELAELIVPPEYREAHRQGIARYLATGAGPVLGRRIEIEGMRSDGARILVELAITPVPRAEPPFFTAYLRDITALRQADRRRRVQYSIAQLLSGSRGMSEIGAELLAELATISNWVFAAMWVRRPDGVLENTAIWHVADRDFPNFAPLSGQLTFEPGRGIPGQVAQDGEPRWVSDVSAEMSLPRAAAAAQDGLSGAFAFPLHGSSGVLGVVELFSMEPGSRDDDLVLVATALGRNIGQFLERRIAERELQRQKQAAEEASAAKDRLMAAVSHELRTPLTPVMLWVRSVLKDGTLGSEMRRDLEMVERNIRLEGRLIDDLLDFTRLSHDKLRLVQEVHDVHRLLRDTLEIVRSEIEAKGVTLSMVLGAAHFHVFGDMTRLLQVFWNLVHNGGKFTPPGGKIEIRTNNAQPGSLVVEVEDTGKGISEEMLPHIFKPFEQAGSQLAGLGLGLAISKSLVELHGGSLRLTSGGLGHGTKCTVCLPCVDEPQSATPSPGKPLRRGANHSLRLLLVEDHQHTAEFLERLLTREGHQVQVHYEVKSALEAINSCDFDLVISDIGLPDGSGLEVMEAARSRCGARGIAMSGYGQQADIEKHLAAGFSAHLTKPIDFEDLKELIQRCGAK